MRFLLFLVLLCSAQTIFAQTKFDEYEKTDSDSESIRILNFIDELKKDSDNKGLIIVYIGIGKNISNDALRHIEGIKLYLGAYKLFPPEKFQFKIAEGKKYLFKEFWVYKKGEELPKIEKEVLNFDNLQTNYLFAEICAGCSPAEAVLSTSSFVGFKTYSEILRQYPNYKSLIEIHLSSSPDKSSYREALSYATEYRKTLVRNFQINKKRVSIKIIKSKDTDSQIFAKFFIVP